MNLAGNKDTCYICGKKFVAMPPLRPNIKDKEFYGGRVQFFKEVECDCKAKYDLCISKRIKGSEAVYEVIDMIILQEGLTDKERMAQAKEEAEKKAIETIREAVETGNRLPTVTQRQEIKRQAVLATVIDKDTKMATLTHMTVKELRNMLKKRKLKFSAIETKVQLAEKLLEYDPSIVQPK